MPQSFACLYTHVVFSTKNRLPLITPEVRPRLYAYMGGIVRSKDSALLAIGGTDNHVHMLLSLGKNTCISEAIRTIKTNSSKWIHDSLKGLDHFAWQSGYGAFSVSQSRVQAVKDYIASQEEHHRKQTFQQEFIAFLKRHSVAFDERFIWR